MKPAGKAVIPGDGQRQPPGGEAAGPASRVPIAQRGSRGGAPVAILCIDADSLLLDFLGARLEEMTGRSAVVFKAWNGAEGLRLARQHELDLAIFDLGLPDQDGLSLAVELAVIQPGCRRLLVSGNLTENHANRLLHSNVHGCLLKSRAHHGELVTAMRELLEGRTYFPLDLLAQLAGARRKPGHFSKILSDRETELLPYFGYGWSHEHIARRVMISPATVRTHLQHILAKLGLHGREELMRWTIKMGFVDFRHEPAGRHEGRADEKPAGSPAGPA